MILHVLCDITPHYAILTLQHITSHYIIYVYTQYITSFYITLQLIIG